MRDAFDKIDVNGDNSISIEELQKAYKVNGQLSVAVEAIMKRYATNDSLDFSRFKEWCVESNAVEHWLERDTQ